jgi:hypothetical protein
MGIGRGSVRIVHGGTGTGSLAEMIRRSFRVTEKLHFESDGEDSATDHHWSLRIINSVPAIYGHVSLLILTLHNCYMQRLTQVEESPQNI